MGIAVETWHRWMHSISAVSIIVMTIAYLFAVAGRWLGQRVVGMFELNELMMVVCIFLGLAYAQTEKRHVRITIVTSRLSKKMKPLVNSFAQLLSGAFLIFVTYRCFLFAVVMYQVGEYRVGDIAYPVWPFRILVTLGFGFLAVQFFIDFCRDFNEIIRNLWSRIAEQRMG